jgi:hypothetical protein
MPKAKKKHQVSPKLPNSQLLEGAEYILDYEKGLRRVKPYYFEFKTWVKGRWLGKTLTEIFTTEFRDRDTNYYVLACSSNLANRRNKQSLTAKCVSMENPLQETSFSKMAMFSLILVIVTNRRSV